MTKKLTKMNKVLGTVFGITGIFGIINLLIGISRLYWIAFDGIAMNDPKMMPLWQ